MDTQTKITSQAIKAKIIVLQGKSTAPSYDLIGNEIILGRDETCDIIFEDLKVSSRHAKIIKKDLIYSLQDCQSTNGTFVNHTDIKETVLTSGDHIQIGDVILQFAIFDENLESFSLEKNQLSSDATQSGIYLPTWEPQSSYTLKKQGKRFFQKHKIAFSAGSLFLLILAYFISEQKSSSPQKTVQETTRPKLDPEDSLSSLTQEDKEYVLAKLNQAKDFAKNRQYQESQISLQEALRIAPQFKPALDLQIIVQQTLDIQRQEEKQQEAVASEQKLEEEIKYHLGVALDYFNRQQWGKAVQEYDKILELHPEHEEAQEKRQLAQEKVIGKEKELEEPTFAQIQKKKNKEAEKLLAEGTHLSQKGKVQEALSTWRKVFQMEGIDSRYYAKAEQFINFTKKQLEQKYEPLFIEVNQLIESKEHTKAKEILETILKEYPSHEKAKEMLSKVHFALHGIAKRHYTEAVIDENMGRIEAAKEKFQWIVDRIPAGDEYHQKSKNKLKKYE